MYFVKKLFVCEEDIMWTDYTITYGSLVQDDLCEDCSIAESKRWEPTGSNKNSKDYPLILKAPTVEIEAPVKNNVEKFYFKNRHNGKYNNSVVGSSTKSVATCHKCGKKVHLKRNYKSNRNGSYWVLSKI